MSVDATLVDRITSSSRYSFTTVIRNRVWFDTKTRDPDNH